MGSVVALDASDRSLTVVEPGRAPPRSRPFHSLNWLCIARAHTHDASLDINPLCLLGLTGLERSRRGRLEEEEDGHQARVRGRQLPVSGGWTRGQPRGEGGGHEGRVERDRRIGHDLREQAGEWWNGEGGRGLEIPVRIGRARQESVHGSTGPGHPHLSIVYVLDTCLFLSFLPLCLSFLTFFLPSLKISPGMLTL